MYQNNLPDNPYLLLTPGPLSTTKSVKGTMLRDWCTWDDDYNCLVQEIREELLEIAGINSHNYTSVLMQGSGTFAVESVIGSVIPEGGKLLVITNGAYGKRIATIAKYLKIPTAIYDAGEIAPPDIKEIDSILQQDKNITHVALVHCETTTGMLNDIEKVGMVVKKYEKVYIVDAMSSFGGVPIDIEKNGIDFLISSANKCIQGVPGFGFIIANRKKMKSCEGQAHSLSLDLYDQWKTMETYNGKWRFTSPTHVVRAFRQAITELKEEGGVNARFERYSANQKALVSGMRKMGIQTLLPDNLHSPIITTFISPEDKNYDFKKFYNELKARGFVIYPGKVTDFDCFRIGNIGEVFLNDIEKLIEAIRESMYWK